MLRDHALTSQVSVSTIQIAHAHSCAHWSPKLSLPLACCYSTTPSASLDPTAEHDLFKRLRKLRGNKTMIFSHSPGGTHDELMKKGGEYARIWNLQAKSFILTTRHRDHNDTP
ncbi:hypothetical protein DFJ58DRAFT_754153, partial [Suillus subalutaceus]|uniref:uncharacterized protein n=1 Tax=Suillus subalutaceus TaxID=48586 RepID=UPI001B886463